MTPSYSSSFFPLKSLFLGYFLAIGLCSYAQILPITYSRAKIDLTHTDIRMIAELGLEADHGVYVKGRHLINDYSSEELELLEANGIPFDILIEDVKAHYVQQNMTRQEDGHDHGRMPSDCSVGGTEGFNYQTPENYAYGSMGGYLTYSEMLAELDEMVELYPELISPRQEIEGHTTFEGRPIEWLRISDNPNLDEETEPEVLYTALHHAREPNSLSQLIFYMWYLLENYETDPEVQYLVDQTEMFFIPCVNPDGYVYNGVTDPNGGGLWRKNRYNDGGFGTGIDLNRNYGYEWGFDNQGSSPNPSSETYRGSEPFSEPETQAVRDFCNERNLQICLNYHTFGNLLIYPWGYSDSPTSDAPTFNAFSEVMTRENNFTTGTGTETVGYTVNGDSDDWMYGEQVTKPLIYSMTPEIGPGNFGFWPPESMIDELNKSVMLQNLTAAHLLLNYGEAYEVGGSNGVTELNGSVEMSLKKFGLLDGDLTLSLTELTTNVTLDAVPITWTMTHLDEQLSSFAYSLDPSILNGDVFKLLVSVDNGDYVWTDTLSKTFINGDFDLVYEDDGSDMSGWDIASDWTTTTEDFVTGPSSITDSPFGDYDGNDNVVMTLDEPLDLSNASLATLSFYCKWDIENDYDFVQVMASTDGGSYTPLCGLYTNLGTGNQDFGQPLYDSTQDEWVLEEIDLADYLGEEMVYLRVRLISDGFLEGDGFYMDDITVSVITDGPVDIQDVSFTVPFEAISNPFSDELFVRLDLKESFQNLELVLSNPMGQVISMEYIGSFQQGQHQRSMDTSGLAAGFYVLELRCSSGSLGSHRVVKQ